MKKIALHNLGCSKNQVDGQQMLGQCLQAGFILTENFSIADIIIVNTCSFIQEATQEAINAILEMTRYKTEGVCSMLCVAGCFSQRYSKEAKTEFPEVDLWLSVQDWPMQLHKVLNTAEKPTFIRQLSTPIATQYLKIAEGCSHRCSFCAIPSIRGNFKGRDIPDVLAEAQWLESQGVKECILVSQDTSYFGKDRGTSLLELLAELLSKTTFPWIRLMYLHPALVGKDFLRFVALHKRILPYFDIPLQHISDEILIAMKRQPLSEGMYELVDSIRDIVPDAAMRTTFITGFPGEKEKHFAELMDFVEYARFERLGVFPFSPETGTAAFAMNNRPRTATAVARCEDIMTLQAGISREKSTSRINKILEVIIDTDGSESSPELAPGCLEGRTMWDAPEVDGIVSVENCSAAPGSIIPVKITGASDYDLKGTAIVR